MGSAARKKIARLMDFPMSLEAMYQGEGVRRQAWKMGDYIWHSDGLIHRTCEGGIFAWVPDQADLLADDWLMVE